MYLVIYLSGAYNLEIVYQYNKLKDQVLIHQNYNTYMVTQFQARTILIFDGFFSNISTAIS